MLTQNKLHQMEDGMDSYFRYYQLIEQEGGFIIDFTDIDRYEKLDKYLQKFGLRAFIDPADLTNTIIIGPSK